VIIEFMTAARMEILSRLAEYTLRLNREIPFCTDPQVNYDAIGFVINLTGSLSINAHTMRPPHTGGLGSKTSVYVKNLCEVSAKRTLTQIAKGQLARCVLVWVPLMKGANDPKIVAAWEKLARAEPDESKRADLGSLAKLFCELVEHSHWDKLLEDWNVMHSKFVSEIEQRGEQRAWKQAVSNLVLGKLGSLPADIQEHIQQQADPQVLEGWNSEIGVAAKLDVRKVKTILGMK
jgi:hypothetical protein